MSIDRANPASDVWSDWLQHGRYGNCNDHARLLLDKVQGYTQRVLDGARLAPGMTLADIGTGEGVVAFSAIDRVGPLLQVVLTDISESLLNHATNIAKQRGIQQQCKFLVRDTQTLHGIDDNSIDAVTTRAVLAYVPDKLAALHEFHRVLKPGGQISIAEPIMQDDAFSAKALRDIVFEQSPNAHDRFLPLLHRWKAAQYPDTTEKIQSSAIANYSERDLLNFFQMAGFTDMHLELHIDLKPAEYSSWDVFVAISPHPLAPSLSAIFETQFTSDEQQFFEQVMRPLVETGKFMETSRIAYLTAQKPSGPSLC